MVRRNRDEKISEYHLGQIDRACFKLNMATDAAQLALKPFRAHWDAIDELNTAMKRAINLLNDRPADYEQPHAAPMSQGVDQSKKLQSPIDQTADDRKWCDD